MDIFRGFDGGSYRSPEGGYWCAYYRVSGAILLTLGVIAVGLVVLEELDLREPIKQPSRGLETIVSK